MRTTQVVSALRSPSPDAFELLWSVLMPRVRGVARATLGIGVQITRPTSLADEGLMKLASGKFDESLRKRSLLTVKQLQDRAASREELVELARARISKRGFTDQLRQEIRARLQDDAKSPTLDELWSLHLREFIREAPGALKPVLKNLRNERVRSRSRLKRDAADSDADPHELARGGASHTEVAAARDVLRQIEKLGDEQFKLRDAEFAVRLYCYERSGQFTCPELAELFSDRRGHRTAKTFLKYIQADVAIVQRRIDRLVSKR